MKREISEATLPGRTVDLWTPWGILRLTDPGETSTQERKPRSRVRMRPAGDMPVHERPVQGRPVQGRPVRERDAETRA